MLSLRSSVITLALFVASTVMLPANGHAEGASEGWVATPDGLVGVQQIVSVHAAGKRGQAVTVTFANPAAGSNSGQSSVDSSGFAYLPWTPDLPGNWDISATIDGQLIDDIRITVAAMATRTVLEAPAQVRAGRPIDLIAEVHTLGGSIAPSGSVFVRNQNQEVVASGSLVASMGTNLAKAIIEWTPQNDTSSLVASFESASSAFGSSTSIPQTPIIGGNPAISLRLPPVSYVGVTEQVSAVIGADYVSPLGGSVAFSLNTLGVVSYPMGGSQPIGDGVGGTQWTPTQSGVQTVTVEYSSANFTTSGKTSQQINVQPSPSPDAITVRTGATVSELSGQSRLQAGQSISLTPASLSGYPVALTTDGPCVITASTFTALTAGNCTITAHSLGNGGSLASASATYVVEIQ